VREAVDEAVRMRARASRQRGERVLRQLGVRHVTMGSAAPKATALRLFGDANTAESAQSEKKRGVG
jgi:hypothetical protein